MNIFAKYQRNSLTLPGIGDVTVHEVTVHEYSPWSMCIFSLQCDLVFFVRNDPITNIVMWLMSCLFILVLFLSVMEIFQLHKHVTFKKHPRSKYNKQVYCLSPRHGWKIPQIIKTIYMYIITLKQPSVVVKKRYFISVHSSLYHEQRTCIEFYTIKKKILFLFFFL